MAQGPPGLEIDDGEVCVIALRHPTLSGDAEHPLHAVARQVHQPLEGQPPVGHMVQHHREQGLHAGHAGG